MAKEARVVVKVDTTQAKREMDQVNNRLEQTKRRGAAIAGSLRTVAKGAALGVAALGGAAELVSPGIIGAAGGTARDLASSGLRSLFPDAATKMDEFNVERDSLKAASQKVQELVSRGGNITDEEIKRLIIGMERTTLPGLRNAQQVENVRREIAAERAAEKLANAADKVDQTMDRFNKFLGG